MWNAITFLSALALVIIGFLAYIIITERNELVRRSAELKGWFEKLSATDIQPQSDWPSWARYNYDTYYKDYRKTFDWCAYRMQHLVASKYTVKVLEGKFYWLHQEQETLQRLLQNIEKYRKVPEMKIQLQKRHEALRGQVEQLKERSFLHSRYESISTRLSWVKTDDQDIYSDMYRSLERLKDDLDDLEKDLSKEKLLKAA